MSKLRVIIPDLAGMEYNEIISVNVHPRIPPFFNTFTKEQVLNALKDILDKNDFKMRMILMLKDYKYRDGEFFKPKGVDSWTDI